MIELLVVIAIIAILAAMLLPAISKTVGFTLIELLVVIAIIAILAALLLLGNPVQGQLSLLV